MPISIIGPMKMQEVREEQEEDEDDLDPERPAAQQMADAFVRDVIARAPPRTDVPAGRSRAT